MNTTEAVTEADVIEALRRIVDPEMGMNLVDLGLVYQVTLERESVRIVMTFTAPGCPMGGELVNGVRLVVAQLPGIHQVDVEVVWDPPWHPAMMSSEAKRQLGLR